MGTDFVRQQLITLINEAFSEANVLASAGRVRPLAQEDDFLSICHKLELLRPVLRTTLEAYREELTMPPLARDLMTVAFRAAVGGEKPVPLHLRIEDGRDEAVAVRLTHEPHHHIAVLLTRTTPPVVPRP